MLFKTKLDSKSIKTLMYFTYWTFKKITTGIYAKKIIIIQDTS